MVKKNKIVYLGILGTILINCFGAGIVSAYEYACEFRDLTTCTGNWANIVVKISDTSNAHAEEWDQSNYNYGICCNWTTTSRTFSPPTTNITHIFPSFGSLSIKCRPAGKIFIDDKLYKNNSSSVYIGSIVEGIHSIKIKKFGYATYTGTITINKNSTTKVSYNYSFSKKTWVKR